MPMEHEARAAAEVRKREERRQKKWWRYAVTHPWRTRYRAVRAYDASVYFGRMRWAIEWKPTRPGPWKRFNAAVTYKTRAEARAVIRCSLPVVEALGPAAQKAAVSS